MRIGAIDVDLLCDGTFRLDGGAMFGVVPKPLWEKKAPPDSLNRILLGLHPLLIRTPGRVILVDTGIGRKEKEKFREIFAVGGETDIVSSLARFGLAPEDVDTVVCTHLHFDHAGGGTRLDAGGQPVPTFPRARHLLQRAELEDAEHPSLRARASYFPENWEPLRAARLLDIVDGEFEVAPGVRTLVMKGHIRAQMGVVIESGGARAIYPCDMIPTSAHVPIPWVMGYDLYPLDTVAFKEAWIPRIADEEWIVFFEHDPEVGAAKIHRNGKEWRIEEILPAPIQELRAAGGAR
jgi:glyoxylase-like metal-dependent hydrolase (beta-lactamase superfamily II)